MNIVSLELSFTDVFHIIPHLYITIGRSVFFCVNWLNFELCVKHISTKYDSRDMSLHLPSVTLRQYPRSSYRYTFEIYAFGYFYRKGLFRFKDQETQPFDNTEGFVTMEWFEQFRGRYHFTQDFLAGLDDMVKGIIEKLKNNPNYRW